FIFVLPYYHHLSQLHSFPTRRSSDLRNKMVQSRCAWVTEDPLSIQYHDNEWGRLEQFENDHYLFEMLVLEGAQSGLSWMTILKRREAYRAAYEQFDTQKVTAFDDANVQDDFGSFHAFLWQFAGEKQIINEWKTHAEIPTSNSLSTALAKDLKRRGFSFVGPVICYAYLQAIGIIQDHTAECFLYKQK